ncbi:GDCCVxC domain-containing (seleno)protein [Sphingosinithalassobacter sp. LHW66-3]
MPTDACWFFYDCHHCGVKLRPLSGDCCVFCSFADVPCPPIQEAQQSGSPSGCCGAG